MPLDFIDGLASSPHTLREHVRNSQRATPPLPLVHTTDFYGFRSILVNNALSPADYPESLLHCFYGLPVYKPHKGLSATSAPGFAPVCFVLAPTCPCSIKRIYPFDSGAFSKGLFKD